jgi:cysteine-rich repeat protein
MGGPEGHPVFKALSELLACEDNAACAETCVPEPRCGDGVIQDRNLDFTFVVDGQEVECADELTATDRGCSFEECDDGNDDPGDGCDEHCFLEVCGNHVTQADEECDDGNDDPDDGCNLQCETTCGNGVVDGAEECDPPGGDHMCSEAEFMQNPSQCACDARCDRIWCGNGVTQRPHEDCDPPNGFSCGTDCKRIDESPCEECIGSLPDTSDFNELYCNVDQDCVEVKQCVIESQCFLPIPAACYCGPIASQDDVDRCGTSDFVPTGPCNDEIRAGAGGDGVSNSTILDRLTDDTYPTGIAMLILDEASRACTNECFPTAP